MIFLLVNQNEVCIFESLNTLSFNALSQSDIIVPDTKSDISNVIRVSGYASINDKNYKNGKVNISGKVLFKIIYVGDDDIKSINLIEHSAPFNHEADFSDDFDKLNTIFTLNDTTFSYDIINTRKISVSCEMKISASSVNNTNHKLLLKSDGNDDGVFVKSQNLTRDALTSCMNLDIPISENFTITDDGSEYEILDICIKDNIESTKIVNTKLVTKLLSNIFVLYRVDSKINSFNAQSTHTEIIDVENLSGEDKILLTTYPSGYDYEIDITQSGVSLKLDYNIVASLLSFAAVTDEFVNDIYSVNDNYEVKNSELKSVCIDTYEKNTVTIKDEINLHTENIKEVLFMDSDLYIKDIKSEDSKTKLLCNAKTNLIYKNENDVVKSVNHKTPFEIQSDFILGENESVFMPSIKCTNLSYIINSPSTVSVRILADSQLNKLKKCKNQIVTQFNVIKDENNEIKKTPSFVIYYPTQKMPIWDVAKKFNSSKEEIIKTNSLTDTDFLPNDKPILIPKMKKSSGK